MALEKNRKIFKKNLDRYRSEWRELLRIKSISTDAAYKENCMEAARWVEAHLGSMGLSAEYIETTGQPVVFAEYRLSKEAPTLLFYGHYDVQPVDPLPLWNTDPFDPTEKDGKMYARGAQDNKGQLFYLFKALEAAIAEKSLRYNVKVLIEGEEECGSGSLTAKLPELASRLKSDVLLVCDTGTLDKRLGCITMGLRGIIHLEIRIHGPNKDLHSGVHGGLVKNPAVVLAQMVASLHDCSGKIAIPGFYDSVRALGADDLALANSFQITDDWYRSQVGMPPSGGEQGISPAERRGVRPTIEVNGMYSGYTGEGSKTIIPSSATVKISSRIVADQDPEKTLQSIVSFLQSKTPPEMRYELVHAGAAGRALLVSAQAPVVQKAAAILRDITGTEPLYLWEGASIPLIPALMQASGASPLLVGFGLEEDNIHAPNESFMIEQFEKGFLFCMEFLGA